MRSKYKTNEVLNLFVILHVYRFLLALKDKPENNPIEDDFVQEQNHSENNPELEDNTESDNGSISLEEISAKAEPEVVIPEQETSCKPHEAYRSILSPLTLFLLGGGVHTRELSSKNCVQSKLWCKAQKID